MGMNFFYGDGYGIVKPVPAPPRCHPYVAPSVKKIKAWHLAVSKLCPAVPAVPKV